MFNLVLQRLTININRFSLSWDTNINYNAKPLSCSCTKPFRFCATVSNDGIRRSAECRSISTWF
jgi:hypothetical protein